MSHAPSRQRVLLGFVFALCAGALWGTTGPLSTALYAEGSAVTDVGFWRVVLATLGFLAFGLFRPSLFRIDRRGLVLVGVGGGVLVALFEVAYQYAIAGVGVAGAATLLYTAPVMVALLARAFLGERLTPQRILLAVVVALGVWLTVTGHAGEAGDAATERGRLVGVLGGLLSAASFAGTTILARWSVPRYGAARVLFFELAGGSLVLALFLPLAGNAPAPAASLAGWIYVGALGLGAVLAANFFFFAGVRRIDAAPASVAASIEPVVGALLALLLFGQGLTPLGWAGLALVVAGVGLGYLREAGEAPRSAPVASRPAPA